MQLMTKKCYIHIVAESEFKNMSNILYSGSLATRRLAESYAHNIHIVHTYRMYVSGHSHKPFCSEFFF